ncbi:hypothetical protein [Rhodoferax ferrireducens]|uniref:hypothetical protein n=1 Tax=Rhodoferax ferrireducens TaxID=192843 RepID=UPI000E0D682A|nr:hypothetical protein [Rhodoferax ferrireducens]
MSLSSSTLSAIQKTGAAAFTADEKLKSAVKEYAERVHTAMAANPYNLGNDALIEDWKTVARLSKTMAGIEAEIKKIFQVAIELTGEDQPSVVRTPALATPTRAAKKVAVSPEAVTPTAATAPAKKAKQKSKPVTPVSAAPTRSTEPSVAAPSDLAPTDVVIKSKKKTPKTSAAKSTQSPIVAATVKTVKTKKVVKPVKAAKVASLSTNSQELVGNAAKLMTHLASLLNSNEFTELNQTTAANETGIPLGSMTAAIKKLLDTGRIVAGPTGSFKLADVQPPVAA